MLDYYMPNQAQRERAYRELLSRDYCTEGNVVELPGRLPVARVEGSGADNANGEVISASVEEESSSRDKVEVEQGDGRDADDDVSGVPSPQNVIDSHRAACVTGGFRLHLMLPSTSNVRMPLGHFL